MLNDVEVFTLRSLGRAMRAGDDALALALFNEYKDYQNIFKPMEDATDARVSA